MLVNTTQRHIKGKKPEVLSKFFILQGHDFTHVSQGHPSSNTETLSHHPINSIIFHRRKYCLSHMIIS